MKIAKALLALLSLAVLSVPITVEASNEETWVSNQSSMGITASINYDFSSNPGFQNRKIPPQGFDHDEYDGQSCEGEGEGADPISLEIWVDNASTQGYTSLPCDKSVVAVDKPGSNGVDIYWSVYGYINEPDYSMWLLTIYP